MKELDSFTVERLEKWINTPGKYDHRYSPRINCDELRSLARIALAAKRAEPVYQYHTGIINEEGDIDWYWMDCDKGFYSQYDHAHRRMAYITPSANSFVVPMQPLRIDQFGTLRFKANPIIQHLLDVAGIIGVDMNTIAMQEFEAEDQMQFAQLIGYSLSGYGELSYVTDESYERASTTAPTSLLEGE